MRKSKKQRNGNEASHGCEKSSASAAWSTGDRFFCVLLVAVLLVAYHPAWHGTPVWDDAAHLTKPQLCSWTGFYRIWFELGATQQYYPVTHTAFWLQHWLWGDAFIGYHLVSVILHAGSALLLMQILRRLEIPGAWLAAGIWALHPIQVESVAWISELKNTLSGFFYFSAALLYLRFDRERSRRVYLAALALFILGLLAKSAIATSPAALLLLFYWKYGRLGWRKDVRPLIPFFGIGIASGLFTAWVERTLIGADGGDFHFSLLERGLIAGRAFWFYLGKLIWPENLVFIYPRWQISASYGWQFLYPMLALGLVTLLVWKRSRWGRGPLVAVLYFIVTLFPALGFLNIYPFRFSFVADHFQYLACIGPMVLFSASLTRLEASGLKAWPWLRIRCSSFQVSDLRFLPILCIPLLTLLAFLSWKQSAMYAGMETLWRTTLDRNPQCWMAYNNLGLLLYNHGHVEEAVADYHKALQLNPAYAEAHDNLGGALLQQRDAADAIDEFHLALEVKPEDADALVNLGNALTQFHKPEEAIIQLNRALLINPANAEALNNLGNALFQQGRTEKAITRYREALQINPADADARYNLGNAMFSKGLTSEAILQMQTAYELQPANLVVQNELAWLLATAPKASERNGARALDLAIKASQTAAGANNPFILRTMAAAYAETGDFSGALQSAQRALQLAEVHSNAALAAALNREIKFYEVGRPFRERP